MTNEELLGEVEELLRTTPSRATIRQPDDENLAWFGRASAVMAEWDRAQNIAFQGNLRRFQTSIVPREWQNELNQIMTAIHTARYGLRMKTTGPLSAAINRGMVFDYFDELRKIIETARTEVFFIDPFLDAEFVPRYLSHVVAGVQVRLLARERVATLLPAVEAFSTQTRTPIAVRSAQGFHDRHLIVDDSACYQSGASFKDGGRTAPTTLTQITDAFAVVLQTYDNMWVAGTVLR